MSDLWIKSPVGSNRKLRKKLSFLYLIKSRDLSVKMDRVCWASWISPLAGVIISPLCQALSVRVFFFSAVMYGLSIAIKYLLTLFFGGLTKGDRRGLSPQSILSHLLWQAALWGIVASIVYWTVNISLFIPQVICLSGPRSQLAWLKK